MSDRIFTSLIWSIAIFVAAILFWILADVTIKGLSSISWSFLIEVPSNSGRSGGISSILLSTFWILAIALIAAVPLGLCVAICLSEFINKKTSGLATAIRLSLDVLAGVPSIIYGLFGNAFFCIYLGMGFSILSGGLTLACMILPIFIRTCEAGLSAVNNDWRHGALALAMSRSSVIWNVLLPAASPAIAAGLILGIGRATAETAALIFTSGYVDRAPESVFDSGRALSVHIYDLSMNVIGGDASAYGTAFVLISLIVFLNIIAQYFTDLWLGRKLLSI